MYLLVYFIFHNTSTIFISRSIFRGLYAMHYKLNRSRLLVYIQFRYIISDNPCAYNYSETHSSRFLSQPIQLADSDSNPHTPPYLPKKCYFMLYLNKNNLFLVLYFYIIFGKEHITIYLINTNYIVMNKIKQELCKSSLTSCHYKKKLLIRAYCAM